MIPGPSVHHRMSGEGLLGSFLAAASWFLSQNLAVESAGAPAQEPVFVSADAESEGGSLRSGS